MLLLLWATFVLCQITFSAAYLRGPVVSPPRSRRVFIQYKAGTRDVIAAELAQRSSATTVHHDFDFLDAFALTMINAEIEYFLSSPNVLAIYDDVQRYTQFDAETLTRRTLSVAQTVPYGVKLVEAEQAWKSGIAGAGVKVCLVDTGIDGSHDDLEIVGWLNNTIVSSSSDGIGHGTHIAGSIAARDNGIGVIGVAPDAEILSVKIFSDFGGYAHSSDVIASAKACASLDAKIISMSLGGPLSNPLELQTLHELFVDKNVIAVAAAGNLANDLYTYPASYDSVVSVTAVDRTKKIASFAQYNGKINVAAPGVEILSTFPMKEPCVICRAIGSFEYGTISGTSMAVPHVSGVLALLWSFKPLASTAELVEAIEASAEDLGVAGYDERYGHGLIQAHAALQYLNAGNPVPPNSNTQSVQKASSCVEGDVLFELNLVFDDFPKQTTWELRHSSNGAIELTGGNYESSLTEFIERCVPDDCYTFIVYDSNGDGICCSNGRGGYNIMFGGEVYAGTGEFEHKSVQHLGDCQTLPSSPVSQNSFKSFFAENQRCPSPDEAPIDLILWTDSHPEQSTIKLTSFPDNHLYWWYNNLPPNKEFQFTECVSRNRCYKLAISDAFGDGLRKYQVFYDNQETASGRGFMDVVPIDLGACSGHDQDQQTT